MLADLKKNLSIFSNTILRKHRIYGIFLQEPHTLKNNNYAKWWWCMPLIPTLRRERQVGLCDLEASLVYRVTSKTAKATQGNPVLKNPLPQRICQCGKIKRPLDALKLTLISLQLSHESLPYMIYRSG